jgi:hypothetical protein
MNRKITAGIIVIGGAVLALLDGPSKATLAQLATYGCSVRGGRTALCTCTTDWS